MDSQLDWTSFGGGTGVLTPNAPTRRQHKEEVPSPPDFLPPDIGGGDDGGGGWGGGDDENSPQPDGEPSSPASFALNLACAGIATFFLIFIVLWFLLRKDSSPWRNAGSPPALHLLWISTALLVGCSAALVRCLRRGTNADEDGSRRALGLAFFLGSSFLTVQTLLWLNLIDQGLRPSSHGFGAIFYAVTGLHALHVLGGLGYLAWLFAVTRRGLLNHLDSVRLCARYWHFLGGLWLVLFAVLYLD